MTGLHDPLRYGVVIAPHNARIPPRDDTDNVIRSQLRKKTVGSTTKEKNSQTNLAFSHNIPPIGA